MRAPVAIPCKIYRGGTSRGLFFDERDLPDSREVQRRILLRALGSPDVRQIDGLGGANSQTSKAMLLRPVEGADADLRMQFAQIGVPEAVVDWGGNCGNLTAAVGPYAIDSGLVPATEPETLVRIVSANTRTLVHAHIPTRDGAVETEGDFEIPGVPGHGVRIDLEWLEPGGSVTGRLLPTGKVVDRLDISDGRAVEVSIVDAGNPVVFCEAKAMGLEGVELPEQIEAREDAMRMLEEIRSIVAEMLGIVPSRDIARHVSPGLPKVAMVAPASTYRTSQGGEESREGHDLQARLLAMQTAHRSYAVTAGIATAIASLLNGSLVHACSTPNTREREMVRIAHPYGVMDVRVRMDYSATEPKPLSASVGRTARLLMSGLVYVPASVLTDR